MRGVLIAVIWTALMGAPAVLAQQDGQQPEIITPQDQDCEGESCGNPEQGYHCEGQNCLPPADDPVMECKGQDCTPQPQDDND